MLSRSSSPGIYGYAPNWGSGILCSSLMVAATVLGAALSSALQTCRRVSSLKCVGDGTNFSSGLSLNSAWMSLSGFHPAKSSNLESAIAISGLWFVSPYFFGSCLFSCAARVRSGWIWSGSALEKERIYFMGH